MIMVDGSWMAQFTEDGILANLSDMGYSFDDDIIPATTAICTVDGSVYLAPYYGNVTVMMYNKPLLEAAGYTDIAELDSWEDVMNIAKATSEAGKKGYLLRGGDAESMVVDFLPLLLANNGWVVDSEFKPTVNTDECKAALQQYIDLKAMGDIMVKDDMVAAVSNGDAALAVGWPGWVSNPTEDFNYTVIPTKLTEDDEPKLTAVYGVWTIGVPENAPNKDLSLKLIQHLMDADVQKASVEAGGVPCRKSVLEDPDVLKDHPAFAVVSNALAAGVYRPVMSTWVDYYNTFGAEIDNVVQGVKSVDQGLEDAQMNLEIFLN
jgi:ABC-type glycerol-3-phosphate transport system substrate-binding protein